MKNCFKPSFCFCMLSCQNSVNTTVFGWLALRTGSKNMKKTVVFAVHLKPLVEKTSQNTVFSTRSLDAAKTTQKPVFFSSEGITMSLNTVFF